MAGSPDDHYKVLGLDRSASDADVRRAYKKAALRWHPDKNPTAREHAEYMFKKVAEAYRVLSDAQERAKYDRCVAAGARSTAAPTQTPGASSKPSHAPASHAARPTPQGMEEAYSLFEQFFGGRDPFKDFDKIFNEDDPGGMDAVFGRQDFKPSIGRASSPLQGSVTVTKVTRTTREGFGTVTTETRVQSQPTAAAVPAQPRPVAAAVPAQTTPGQGLRARCLARHGVAWRRSRDMRDRVEGVAGPGFMDVFAVYERQGDWVRGAGGWLPLALQGEWVLELLDASRAIRARCLSQQGVAYRRSMDLGDRIQDVRGPSLGDVLTVRERWGSWLRAEAGWLPLAVGGVQAFELLDEGGPPPRAEQAVAPRPSEPAQRWGWPLALPGLPFRLLTVLGASCYVSLRAARLLFRGWWRMWTSFGLFPRLW
mmetsp:Transcript_83469/g.259546  ORF Transcript_83469/g.259546 Transcript_83469/m.259546 type:complete len:425 (+) Transcript_83469:70-1344(+)